MNSIHDLRATLDQHAGDVRDDPATTRIAAVAARARVVRRRRAAGVGAAAVVVLLAVGSATLLPSDRDPLPSDRELIGREAPEAITSLGYTYAFAEGVESSSDARASIQLSTSDEPRLITWAADADEVRLDTPYAASVSRGTDFDDFAIVHGTESGRWSIRAGGADAAIAVYELTDDLPAGLSQGEVLFREEVGSETLVDAAFGESGDTELVFEALLPEGELRLTEFCTEVPKAVWVNLSINGEGAASSRGCGGDVFDPAVGSATLFDAGDLGDPGEPVEFRMWLSGTFRGEPLTRVPEARLALALYALVQPAAEVAGWSMPEIEEHQGHRWGFAETVIATAPEEVLRFRNEGTQPLLLVGSYSRIGKGRLQFRVGDGGSDRLSAGLGGSDIRGLLLPGDNATMRVKSRGGIPNSAEFGLAVYQRID